MWTNSLLKQNAWKKLKPYYWTAFGVTIMQILAFNLPSLFTNFTTNISVKINGGDVERWYEMLMEMSDMSPEQLEEQIPRLLTALAPIYRWVISVSVVSNLLTILATILILNPIICGICNFYCKGREEDVDLGRFFRYFMGGRYVPVMKTMFFKWLYTFLWLLLFIIPGIVKMYEYYLIPYLLAENPNLSKERAFQISKTTMKGEKWKCFILQMSFIGWYILGWLCCGVGIFFVIPYQKATMAEFYTCMRAKMLAMGYAQESELNPEAFSGETKQTL